MRTNIVLTHADLTAYTSLAHSADAPWCGHCKKLAPIWDALGERTFESSAQIGRVDCTTSNELCKAQGIRAFPTLLYFADGKSAAAVAAEKDASAGEGAAADGGQTLYKYSGPRTADALAAFVDGVFKTAAEYDPTAQPPPSQQGGLLVQLGKAADYLGVSGVLFIVLAIAASFGFCIWGIIRLVDDDDDAGSGSAQSGGSGGNPGAAGSHEELVMVEKDGSTSTISAPTPPTPDVASRAYGNVPLSKQQPAKRKPHKVD